MRSPISGLRIVLSKLNSFDVCDEVPPIDHSVLTELTDELLVADRVTSDGNPPKTLIPTVAKLSC